MKYAETRAPNEANEKPEVVVVRRFETYPRSAKIAFATGVNDRGWSRATESKKIGRIDGIGSSSVEKARKAEVAGSAKLKYGAARNPAQADRTGCRSAVGLGSDQGWDDQSQACGIFPVDGGDGDRLGRLRGSTAFLTIDHPAPIVRARSVSRGDELPEQTVVPALIARLSDPDPVVRLSAHHALRKRTGKDFGYVPWADESERAKAIARWRQWWNERSAQIAQTAQIPGRR